MILAVASAARNAVTVTHLSLVSVQTATLYPTSKLESNIYTVVSGYCFPRLYQQNNGTIPGVGYKTVLSLTRRI